MSGAAISIGRPVVCPDLVGRESTLAALRQLVDRAGSDRGGIVLVSGEAGIGKSRLVAEARGSAVARGFRVLESACFPQDRTCPYAPLLELMRARLAGQPADLIAAELGACAHDLAPLLPDLVQRPGQEVPPALDPEHERRRLFASMCQVLTCQDEARPLLVVIEDLHWSDDGSLDFLHYLGRRTPSQRLLLVGTYRAEDASPRMRQWLAQLDRERLAQEIALAPLSRDEVGAMLAAIFGQDHPVDPGLLDTIYALSEGNPFYVEELLKTLIESGEITVSEGAWDLGVKPIEEWRIPRSLHDTVQQRLARLSPAAREVLTLAAVVGRRFDFSLLQVLAHIDEPTLVALIKELIAAQLVVEESGERFAFGHALIRRVTYTDLLARERAALHRMVAETAERLYANALDRRLDDLSLHFYRAERWEQTLHYAAQAGQRAQRLYAPHAAIEHFSRALDAANHVAAADPREPAIAPGHLADMRRARGRAHETVGDFDSARADYEAVVDLSRAAGDARLELQGLLDLGMLWSGRDYEQSGGYLRQALGLARSVDDPALLAESLNRLGNWNANTAQPRDSLPLHHEALAIFEGLGDRRGIAATLDLLGMASYLSADLAGSMAYWSRAADLFRALDDRVGLASTLAMLSCRGGSYELGSISSDAAEFDRGVADGELAVQLARDIGWRAGEAFSLLQLVVVLGARGQYARAFAFCEQGRRIAEEIEHREWMADAHCAFGQLYLDLLVLARARQHLEGGLALARDIGSSFWIQIATSCLAWTATLQGDFVRATELIGPQPPGDAPVQSLAERWTVFAHAQLALARRDHALALRLVGRLDAPAVDGTGPVDSPRPALIRGEALAGLGRFDDAEATLSAVCQIVHRQDARPLMWRCHALLGNLYRQQQHAEGAQREYAAARALLEEIAEGLPDPELRNEFLRNATARLPRQYHLSPRRVEAARFGGLTPREREVAALVAAGRSNREIADVLVLGERTVETHVSNVLSKLGLASRRQIARWARDRGLTAEEEAF